MKFRLLIILILTFCGLKSQKKFVLVDTQTNKEFVRKDSLSAVKFLDSLAENNYYFTKVLHVEKHKDDTKIVFDKGKNYNTARVSLNKEVTEYTGIPDNFYTKNLDSLKRIINKKYSAKGFTFNRVNSKYIGLEDGIPKVEVTVSTNGRRKINGFVVKGYTKVPKRFIKNLKKEYLGSIYEEKTLLSINQILQNHSFVQLEKPPQTLFTKDSTNIYLFLRKKKANAFDGVIGFGNDKNGKFALNGTLDVNFRNIFNAFETLSLYWQRNNEKGQTFNLNADFPYLFKSNIGMNLRTNIYRQDSAFATAKILPALYYNIGNRMKIGLRGTFESSTINANTGVAVKSFTKKGAGVWYEFTEATPVELFLYKTKIRAEADLLKTTYDAEGTSANQSNYFLFAERNFHISGNHYLNVRGEAAFLDQKQGSLAENEMLRFGGWNSLRGFNEQSLYAEQYYFGGLEYRYLIGKQAFFDVFGQLGSLRNNLAKANPKLYSFGVGFNFFLPIGLMSFQISSGNQTGTALKFDNTKIHWGILSRF